MNGVAKLVLIVWVVSSTWLAAGTSVVVSEWGTLANGESVQLIQLSAGNVSAEIATYGAQIVSLRVPDKNDKTRNVVLGHPDLESALTKGTLGAVIGRYANRISGGGFTIDGKRYDLDSVNKKTSIQIHGGKTGFHKQNWQIEENPEVAGFKKLPGSITLRCKSIDGHEGFPGNVTVWVQYRIKSTAPDIITGVWLTVPSGDLEMEFRAKTDKPTHVNLTNHAYFNLRGEGHGSRS